MRILLTGDFTDILSDMFRFLTKDFEVQVSAFTPESIKGISKVVRPGLIVTCVRDLDPESIKVFEWLYENLIHTPVVVLASKDSFSLIQDYCRGDRYYVVYRPVTDSGVRNVCLNVLRIHKDSEDSKDDEEGDKKRVLIVDDSPMILRSIGSMLREDYATETATSGEEALEKAGKRSPDIVLLDYKMPGMDGLATFERLKNILGEDVPVIFLTSVTDREKIFAALKHRPAGYVLKPPDRNKLIEAIDKALSPHLS